MKLLSVLLALLLSISAQAQFIIDQKSNESELTFSDVQRSFHNWSKDKDLSNTKGWKHFKRWEEHYSQRTNLNGDLPDNNAFLKEAIKYNQLKQAANNDETWVPVGPDKWENEPFYQKGIGRINCVAFHPTDPETLWVGVAQGGIWKTTNSGASWMPINSNLPILRISDIAVDPTNPDVLYVCLGDIAYLGYSLLTADKVRQTHFGIGLYKTINGGESWEPTGLTIDNTKLDYSLLKKVIINKENTDKLIVGGIEGLWQSNDAGVSWEKKLDTMICDLESDPVNSEIIYAATCYINTLNDGHAGVYKSTDFGNSWTLLNTGIPARQCQRVEIEIAPSDPNYIYAIANDLYGSFQGIYQSTNAGETWNLQPNTDNVNIFDWYGGEGSGGQSTYDMVCLVDPSDKNTIYAGGVNLWVSPDGGQTWEISSYWQYTYGESLHADQHRFSYNSVDDKFYICNDGGIYRTDTVKLGFANNGSSWATNWEYISDGMQITSFYRIGISENNPEYVIGGAQDNSTYYFNSESWTNLFGGDGMECIIHKNDPQKIWASSQYGNIGYSEDGGSSFYATGYIDEYGSWTTPFHYNYDEAKFYVAKGNLYESNNNGFDLSPISNFPSVAELGTPAPTSSYSQSLNNADVFYVAKRLYHGFDLPSQLLTTQDGGASWTDITGSLPTNLYYTHVQVDDENSNLAWLTLGGYEEGKKVYKTEDGGVTWDNISYNLPNIPVNTIELDVNSQSHVIYIGTDLGVYYLTDNTNEWKLWGNNLPNVIVSELEINYETNELYVATFGRGIWKINTFSDAVGIDDENNLSTFDCNLYPTINNGEFTLQFELNEPKQMQMNIINIMGSNVYNKAINCASGINKLNVDTSLEFGQYYLQVKSGNRSKVIPFIIN